MKIIEDNLKQELTYPTYVALGSFDGLHLGHMQLINKALQLAKDHHVKSMVCTFKNHPLTVINKDIAPKLIMDNEAKAKLLQEVGIDIVNFIEFNSEFMKISPESFIESLVKCYKVRGIVVGFNFRFGYKNLGDVEMLREFGKKLGFEVHIVEPFSIDKELVSSSKIRHYIVEGQIAEGNHLLGRPYMLSGHVIRGRQLGRTIGFPTINLDYNREAVLPKGGVYYTAVEYAGVLYKGITNIGYNPTVHGEKLSIETYILDFDKEIYDKEVKLYFKERIRDEKKFNGITELCTQLEKDKQYAKEQNIQI